MVVIGSGAAGIATALTAAARGLRVLVVTKDLVGGATPLAQGGLAAAIGPGDSAAAHAADTLAAGAGLCEPDVVTAIAGGAPGAIDWLAGLGAALERSALRLEGGHSRHRIVHSGNDATGAEVHRALLAALLASRAEILDRTIALDLLMRDAAGDDLVSARANAAGPVAGGVVAGVIGAGGALDLGIITARAVVLAAGGLGQVFATTSNPAGATGDAIAMAARAGAVLRDLEFVQFHPTVLWLPGASGQCPLITEALRGAGAVLRDLDGRPLMAGHDPRGDLAPRDVVAARIAEVMAAGGGQHVWLDATGLGREVLEDGFPTVTAACRKHGIDPVTEYIPVAPGAHYSCGGVLADLDGRTTLGGLYAVGEAASTGVQGANRLASNSVTEAVIAGRRAGDAIARARADLPNAQPAPAGPARSAIDRAWRGREERGELAAAMSRYAGVMRDADGLGRLARLLGEPGSALAYPLTVAGGYQGRPGGPGGAEGRMPEAGGGTGLAGRAAGQEAAAGGEPAAFVPAADGLDLELVEAANLRAVSGLIVAGALRRAESRGCHRRRDATGTAERAWHTLVRWDGERLAVAEEPL